MQNYNFLFFLSGNLSEAEIPSSLDNVKSVLENQGAQEIIFENAGRQKLAYPIGNFHYGYLINSFFKIETAKVSAVKEKLGLEPEVIRYVINRQDEAKNLSLAGLSAAASAREAKAYARREAAKQTPVAKTPSFSNETQAPLEEKVGEIKEEKKKAKIDLADINKKIDEILQQDDFVV